MNSKSVSQIFVRCGPLRPMAAASHGWGGVEELLASRAEHRWLQVSCTGFPGGCSREGLCAMGTSRDVGSVQSQQGLSVLILSLLFMFQGPSFYHRLRSFHGLG